MNRSSAIGTPRPRCSPGGLSTLVPAEPLGLQELGAPFAQAEDVGRALQPAALSEERQLLLAQPLDVEGAAGHEMAQVGELLERTGELPGAAAHHGLRTRSGGLLGQRRVQRARAVGRECEGLGARRPLFQDHADDLRDHVAGALQDHRVADPDVLARDLVGVVQGGVDHHHAAHRHRLQPRHRRDRPGAAHLDVDGLQDRAGLLGRELPCDGPAWRARDEAQTLLPVQAIDLVDDAIDVIGEVRSRTASMRA